MKKKCQTCGKEMIGRSDKRFCSPDCKNQYHSTLRRNTRDEVSVIDGYMHRNREILAMLMGNEARIEINPVMLHRAGFRHEYHTSHYVNKDGKTYWLVYDYAWMEFSDQKIIIVRKKSQLKKE